MQTRATIDSLAASPVYMAERVGFEPTNTVRCYTLSRRAPSTARPPLHSGRKGTGGRLSYQIGAVTKGGIDSGPPWPSPCGRAARVLNRSCDFVQPTNTVRCYTLSRRAPSTARPPLHSGRKGTGGRPSYQIGAVAKGGIDGALQRVGLFALARSPLRGRPSGVQRRAVTRAILALAL